MSGADEQTAHDLIAEGRALAPWHLLVDITADISTRDLADGPAGDSLGRVALLERRELFTATLEKLFPAGLAGRSVLDCACNCGGFLFWAKELGAGHCHGIDVREHWIEQANFLTAHRTLPKDHMSFEVLDLYDLPDQQLEPFDVVLFNGIFYHLPDPIAGLKVAAEMAREVLIINTSTTIGLPDGQLTVSGESVSRPVSGVYGLNWFPTGPQVLVRLLEWLGFPEVRTNWWRRLPGQRSGHARLELVAARDIGALSDFDDAERKLPPLARMVERHVPPEATVLVAGPAGGTPLEFEGRNAQPFPPAQASSSDDGALVDQLVRLRGEGAGYLLVPEVGATWLGAHLPFHEHVRTNHLRVAREPGVGVLFSLLPTWQTK